MLVLENRSCHIVKVREWREKMIYTNRNLKIIRKKTEAGTIYKIDLGKKRYENSGVKNKIICSENLKLRKGVNTDHTIILNENDNLTLIPKEDENLYLFLFSKSNFLERAMFVRDKHGMIEILKQHYDKVRIVAGGVEKENWSYHADNILLQVLKSDTILIRVLFPVIDKMRYYLVHENRVYQCKWEDLEDCCDFLKIKVPCESSDSWVAL